MSVADRCQACPVPEGLACVADPALCGLVADPAWAHHVREVSRIARGEPAPVAAPEDPPEDHPKAAEIRARRAERERLRGCANLFTACGCAWGKCLAGRGNASAEVGVEDCRECVATSEAWRAWSI